MKAIGIDIGTTSICGILIDETTKDVIKTINKSNDSWIITDNSYEKLQNPEIIFNTAFSILNELMTDGVKVIGITGQMHGILYVDKNGESVSPLYTWQDGRGNLPYNDTTYAKYLNSFSGYGNTTHFYNEVNNLVPENAVSFCTIYDYFAMKITKRTTPLVHSSSAASFGQYDLKTHKFTTDNKYLPEVTPDVKIIGKYLNIPVTVAIGDNQASFIGCGGDENTLLINIGTGSQVSFITDDIDNSNLEIRPLYGKKYISVGCSLCGGRAYAILENFYREVCKMAGIDVESMYEFMEKGAKESDLSFSTLFSGTRENPTLRGSITNISTENFTPYNITYSCMEGIICELYDMYKKENKRCEKLIASGNGIRKNNLLQNIAKNKFGMDLIIPEHKEEAALGAALFSLLS